MRQLSQEQLMRGLNGSPTYLGRISSTTAKDNTTTVAPFAIPAGALLLLVPTAPVNILPGLVAGGAVTDPTGIPLAAAEKFYLLLKKTETHLQSIGTASLDVWEMD